MARWSIKNYNAWIREARKSGADIKTARAAYRIASERIGRPLYAVDARRHPRILSDSLRSAKRKAGGNAGASRRSAAGKRGVAANAQRGQGGGGGAASGFAGARGSVGGGYSFDDYQDDLDTFGDFDFEYESSADYGSEA